MSDNPATNLQMYGSSLAGVFRAPEYDCRIVGEDDKPEFAITRLRSGPLKMEKAPEYPADRAILICVALCPTAVGQWRAVYDGRNVGVTRAIPFAATYLDLACRMEMWVRGPFDYLHYFMSRDLLNRIAADSGIDPDLALESVFFIQDLVVAQLTKSILAPIKHGVPLDTLALDQIAMILGAHTLQTRCGAMKFAVKAGHGLEPWQQLRSEEILRAHLDGNITVKELAHSCSLSESHFARCFRLSFGMPVHQWLIHLRLERAKVLLSTTKLPLGEISLASGFYDQAAFTRAFIRSEHVSPLKWRRVQRC